MAVKKSKGSADASFGKTKVSQRTLMTRGCFCLVLALLMVASSVYIVLEMLLR